MNVPAIISAFQGCKFDDDLRLIWKPIVQALEVASKQDFADFNVHHDPILYPTNIYLLWYDGIVKNQTLITNWGHHLYLSTDLRHIEYKLFCAIRNSRHGYVRYGLACKFASFIELNQVTKMGRISFHEGHFYLTVDLAKTRKLLKLATEFYQNKPTEKWIHNENKQLAPDQVRAVELINHQRFGLITGAAGTGKTTVIKSICHQLQHDRLYLLAPTNMAAENIRDRLGDTDVFVGTLHRLKIDIVKKVRPYPTHSLIVFDEASMLDNVMVDLISQDCLANGNRYLFVGDDNQLRPVARDSLFRRILEQYPNAVVKLTTNFRSQDLIISNAMLVLNAKKFAVGTSENYRVINMQKADFTEIPLEPSIIFITHRNADVVAINKDMQDFFLTRKYGDALDRFSTMQAVSRPFDIYHEGVQTCVWNWHIGDKARSKKSIPGKVSNGSIGTVIGFSGDNILVDFKGKKVDLNHKYLFPAYAITVHSSQGQEWDHVVFVDYGGQPLNRELFYVALTRAKKRVTIVRVGATDNEIFEIEDEELESERIIAEY